MKKITIVAMAVLGLLGTAQAAPIKYGDNYYEIVNIANMTWDQAKAHAETLYSGQNSHLATLTTQAEYDAVKGLMDYDSWSIAYIGARNVADTYTWINDEGAVNLGAWGSWYTAAGEPQAGDYGMTLMGPSYDSYSFAAEAMASTSIGQLLVEYQAVPEPTAMMLLAVGCAVMLGRRRVSKCA
jgi:hypothetical protein